MNNYINDEDFPKEIQTNEEPINPLFNIISNLQDKLNEENSQINAIPNNIQETNTEPYSVQSNTSNPSKKSNSEFDTSKIFGILNSFGLNGKPAAQKPDSVDSSNPFSGLDINTMMKFGRILSSMNKEDPRKNLLLSLKPFLGNTRQKNVDSYIFMLGILNVLDSFREDSGLDEQ
ncbi:MAG: hypothetical protein PHD20_00765 [Clostridia bacterium]|nr:hypothetical protein [Clostridia bacterium]